MFQAAVNVYIRRSFIYINVFFVVVVVIFSFPCFPVSFVECVYVSVIAITLVAFHRYVAFGTLILNHKNERARKR